MLRELSARRPARIDWPGNITFAVGLIAVMVGITYGIEPYGSHTMGWTSPLVLSCLIGGVLLLGIFCLIETKVAEPMFRLQLFKIRAFSAGVTASLLASLSRGGLMFMLIIWLQGIWLPLHGYDFARTPLWAGIAILPLTFGFLIAGPISGILSDRFGARPFATGGMLGAAVGFALLELLPVDFPYWLFAVLLFFTGLSMACFGSPNRAGVMNSLPAEHRGVGAGMNTTFMNSGQVLSIGIFFTLMIIGLSGIAARQPLPRADAARGPAGGGPEDLAPLAGLHPVRLAARVQPGGRAAGPARAVHAAPCPTGRPDQSPVLPLAHLGAVQVRPARRAGLRHHRQPAGGGRLVDPGREAAGRRDAAVRHHPGHRAHRGSHRRRTISTRGIATGAVATGARAG